jgi:hypothetical protein
MFEHGIYDLLGVLGSLTIIAAYFATQRGWVEASDWRFPLANLIGALLILFSLMVAWNLAAFVMEVFWIAISIYGLARAFAARN